MGSLTEHVNGPFVFIFVMVSYVLAFLPVSMVILELVVHDQYFYARLCRVRPRLARQSRLVWTGLYSEYKQRQPHPSRVPHLALLDFPVWLCLFSELEIDKSDWSLCNQAVQNSVINILPRVCPLTVEEEASKKCCQHAKFQIESFRKHI